MNNNRSCPICNTNYRANSYNMHLGIVNCEVCNSVFEFRDLWGGDTTQKSYHHSIWPAVDLPNSFKLKNKPTVKLIYSSKSHLFMHLAILFLFSGLMYLIANSLSLVDYPHVNFDNFLPKTSCNPWTFLAFYILTCLGVIASILYHSFNKIELSIENGFIIKQNHPIPRFKNIVIKNTEIKTFFLREIKLSTKTTAISQYEIHLLSKNNTAYKLTCKFDSLNQALYIKQELSKHLNT